MHVWRLCRKPFAKKTLDGVGGLHASGRWHSAPRLIVYTSQSLALAGLEMLVHLDPDLPPDDLVALEIEIPQRVSCKDLTNADLPRSWRRYPAPRSVQMLGNAWLDARRSAILRVPSVVIPSEFNYIINPQHPEARHIHVVAKAPFRFDARLLGRA